MAKSKSRNLVGLTCTVCKKQNYITEKNKINTQEALQLKKFCNNCKKVQLHKEVKDLD